jgi:hypothetical protein
MISMIFFIFLVMNLVVNFMNDSPHMAILLARVLEPGNGLEFGGFIGIADYYQRVSIALIAATAFVYIHHTLKDVRLNGYSPKQYRVYYMFVAVFYMLIAGNCMVIFNGEIYSNLGQVNARINGLSKEFLYALIIKCIIIVGSLITAFNLTPGPDYDYLEEKELSDHLIED